MPQRSTNHPWGCLALVAGLLCAISAVVNVAVAEEPALVLPPGYALPALASPAPDPHEPVRWVNRMFSFASPDRLMYRHALDNTPGQWLAGLAEVWVGDGVPWSPESRFAVYPLGLPGEEAHQGAAALLGDRALRFEGNFHYQPQARLKALAPDRAELFFEGVDLLLHDHDRGHHYRFVPIMAGDQPRWRLAAMGLLARPTATTRLERGDAGELTAIHLPNGVVLAVGHTQGLVSRMELPFDRWATFTRDVHGHISELSVFEAGEPGRSPPRRLEQIQFACDAHGRLQRVQTDPRVSWRVDHDPPTDLRLSEEDHLVLLRCSVERGAIFFHESRQRQGHTVQLIRRTGSVLEGENLAVALDDHAFAARTLQAQTDGARRASATDDKRWWPGTSAVESDEPGHMRYQVLRAASPDGEQQAQGHELDGHGRVTAWHVASTPYRYRYSAAGDLLEAQVGDPTRVHRFVTDDWGRIVRHEQPDGSWQQWDFHERGYLIALRAGRTHRWLDDLGSEATREEEATQTTLHHDRQHRLQRVDSGDGKRWQILYDSAGRVRSWHDGQVENRYQYDGRGWLARVDRIQQGWTGYDFRPDGRLLREQSHPRQQRSRIVRYDPQQRIVSEQIQGMGETRYEYDAQGRQARIVHPDGRDTLYTYDALNRIIRVRGSHQPPLDITYDDDGQRRITQPATSSRP